MTGASPAARRFWPWAVFGVALGVRLAAFGVSEARNPALLVAPDTGQHVALARTLIQEGRFADKRGGPAHTRLTPGFAILVAAVYSFAGETPRTVVLLGVVLSSATVAVAALAAARVGGLLAGVAAGLFLAFDTASLAACLRMLTEAPFTFFLTCGVAMAVSYALGARPRPAVAGLLGTFLSVAALIRPVGLLLVFPVGVWLALCSRARGWSRATSVAASGAFLLPWLVLVGGWQVRNYLAAGSYAPSHGPAKFLLLSRGSDIVSQRDGVPFEEARERLSRMIQETPRGTGAREESLYLRPALELIARHPLLFLRTQVRWLPELLLGTGAAPLAGSMGLDVPGDARLELADRLLRIVSVVHLLGLYAAFAWTLWTARRDEVSRRLVIVLLAGVSLYFVLVSTGPQAYSRLRAPIMPLLAIGAGLGFEKWRRLGAGS